MCKPRIRIAQTAQPATGPTTRLGDATYREAVAGTPHRRAHHGGRFPWWTLWLLWPLIELGKWAAPAVSEVLVSLSGLSIPLLPLLLIAIGITLLLVRRRPQE